MLGNWAGPGQASWSGYAELLQNWLIGVHWYYHRLSVILYHSYCCYVNTMYNLFAHSIYYWFNISYFLSIFVFIFFSIPIFMYIFFSLCLYCIIIALSMERTWLTFHCWLYSHYIIVYVANKSLESGTDSLTYLTSLSVQKQTHTENAT